MDNQQGVSRVNERTLQKQAEHGLIWQLEAVGWAGKSLIGAKALRSLRPTQRDVAFVITLLCRSEEVLAKKSMVFSFTPSLPKVT